MDIFGYYSEKNKRDLFITTSAHFSIELNAHNLLGICLLVCQHNLPESTFSISDYYSQSCEATFRLTRSMLGALSSVVNFTIEQFFKRIGKLSVLTELESKSESSNQTAHYNFQNITNDDKKILLGKTQLQSYLMIFLDIIMLK